MIGASYYAPRARGGGRRKRAPAGAWSDSQHLPYVTCAPASTSLEPPISTVSVPRGTAHVTVHTHTGGRAREGARASGGARTRRGRGQARARGGDCTAGAMSVSQNRGRVNNNSV